MRPLEGLPLAIRRNYKLIMNRINAVLIESNGSLITCSAFIASFQEREITLKRFGQSCQR